MGLKAKLLSLGLFLLWSVLAGVIVAAFFVTAFFGDFGPIRFGDSGVVILFVPVFTAFILGLLLVDFELVQTVIAALLATGIAIGLVLAFMYSPDLAGVAVGPPPYEGAFSAVLLFPLILLGTVVGRAIGERLLPPQAILDRQRALMAETREWHEQLSRVERPAHPGENRKP
jgi:hypothetical protein